MQVEDVGASAESPPRDGPERPSRESTLRREGADGLLADTLPLPWSLSPLWDKVAGSAVEAVDPSDIAGEPC